ncbi:hypothetical protein ACHAXR_001516, partial [Thalassiosira sp. AJA248-18]
MTPSPHRQGRSLLLFLATAAAASILYASTIRLSSSSPAHSSPSLRSSNSINPDDDQSNRRQLVASLNLSQFTDPKSVILRTDAPLEDTTITTTTTGEEGVPKEQFIPINAASRKNCQIIYILGVEGATHHGFIPILEALAHNQKDPETGLPYSVDAKPSAIKAGLFGWFYKSKIRRWGFKETPEVDDPAFVQRVVKESCPEDGTKHVMIEWASFPSGHEDDPRTYRVHRQHEWLSMSPEEIANSDEALQHPTNMNSFYQAYSPY